ncbi:MAG: helix-turn-helix domain-containing protein, partial [Lachnospiraceae bacterium]|nr:helix-turn-helix domain-containing protein [Lachnospiraceae bacterium]
TVYMKRLRDKIEEDPQNPEILVTVRGLGYKVGE